MSTLRKITISAVLMMATSIAMAAAMTPAQRQSANAAAYNAGKAAATDSLSVSASGITQDNADSLGNAYVTDPHIQNLSAQGASSMGGATVLPGGGQTQMSECASYVPVTNNPTQAQKEKNQFCSAVNELAHAPNYQQASGLTKQDPMFTNPNTAYRRGIQDSCTAGGVLTNGVCVPAPIQKPATIIGYICNVPFTQSANDPKVCEYQPPSYPAQVNNYQATVTYSCTSGTLSGANCVSSINATATNNCPAGYTLSGTTCTNTTTATVTYTCASGTLSGTSCLTSYNAQIICKGPYIGFLGCIAGFAYQCPAGGSLSGTTCTISTTATANYSCPSGGTLSGTTCTLTSTATVSYSCPTGGTLAGTTCDITAPATVNYSCPNGGVLSGTQCIVPPTCPAATTDTLNAAGTLCTPALQTKPATPIYQCYNDPLDPAGAVWTPAGNPAGSICVWQPPSYNPANPPNTDINTGLTGASTCADVPGTTPAFYDQFQCTRTVGSIGNNCSVTIAPVVEQIPFCTVGGGSSTRYTFYPRQGGVTYGDTASGGTPVLGYPNAHIIYTCRDPADPLYKLGGQIVFADNEFNTSNLCAPYGGALNSGSTMAATTIPFQFGVSGAVMSSRGYIYCHHYTSTWYGGYDTETVHLDHQWQVYYDGPTDNVYVNDAAHPIQTCAPGYSMVSELSTTTTSCDPYLGCSSSTIIDRPAYCTSPTVLSSVAYRQTYTTVATYSDWQWINSGNYIQGWCDPYGGGCTLGMSPGYTLVTGGLYISPIGGMIYCMGQCTVGSLKPCAAGFTLYADPSSNNGLGPGMCYPTPGSVSLPTINTDARVRNYTTTVGHYTGTAGLKNVLTENISDSCTTLQSQTANPSQLPATLVNGVWTCETGKTLVGTTCQ